MTTIKTISEIHRLVVRGKLTLSGSFHVGTGSASRQSDMALRRDGHGHVYIPGSSLAGLMRSIAEDLAPYVCGEEICADRQQPCLTCNLFGWTPGKNQAGGGQASRLVMLDALPLQELPPVIEIRDHVGIDRQRGSARHGLFYNREVAPANTAFSFEFQVQEPDAVEVRLLMAVLELWGASGVRLGGRTTTGLGLAYLSDVEWLGLNFSDNVMLLDFLLPPNNAPAWPEYIPPCAKIEPEDLMEMLGKAPTPAAGTGKVERYLPQRITVSLELEALEPLLVVGYTPKIVTHAGEHATDAAFVSRLKIGPGDKPVDELFLPGSGLKGILRTRAEKIIRTLDYYSGYAKQEDAWSDPQARQKYEKQISACAVTHALGTGEKPSRLNACFGGIRMEKAEGQAEARLYEASCVTCRVFGNTALRGRLVVEDGHLLTEGKSKLFDHVAIDRFSGGAADAKKFDDRPLLPGERFAVTLELQRPELWMVGLLSLLLKDLCDGDISLGHAVYRGYGRVKAWVTGSTALVLPDSELAASLKTAGHTTGDGAAGPFWRVDLGLTSQYTKDGFTGEAGPASAWIEACHKDFLSLCKKVRAGGALGEIQEVQS